MSEPTPPNVQYPSVPQPQGYPPLGQPMQVVQVRPKSSVWKTIFLIFVIVCLVISVMFNLLFAAALSGTHVDNLAHKTLTSGSENKTVAVYRLAGIIDGKAVHLFDLFTRDVIADSKVKAVVIRVESPGGGVTASDEIWAMVRKIKDHDKKVVVSMGSVAASGGYYVSSGADEIIAEETTITGSIGVIMEWFVLERGLNKIGVDPIVLKSTHAAGWKDELSLTKFPDERQKAHLREILDTMQARFEKVVKDGRGAKLKTKTNTYTTTMPAETGPASVAASGGVKTVEVTEIEPLNGKIYLGTEAKALGLVDDIGYLDQAIDRAKKLAGLTNPNVVQYERRKGFFESLADEQASGSIKIDPSTLDELQSARMMLLWKP